MKTNLVRKFLNIIDSCFPNGHPLHKHTQKAQLLLHAKHEKYHLITQQSTTIRLPTVANTNKQQTMQLQKERPMPTGRKMPYTKCSLPSHSHTQTSSVSYIGLATNLKERYRNHTASFRHQSKRNKTELSTSPRMARHIRELFKCAALKFKID